MIVWGFNSFTSYYNITIAYWVNGTGHDMYLNSLKWKAPWCTRKKDWEKEDVLRYTGYVIVQNRVNCINQPIIVWTGSCADLKN